MQSSEVQIESLRIGNKLFHPNVEGNVYTVTAYDIQRFANPKKAEWAKLFSRIPITIQILKKCGFVESVVSWKMYGISGKDIYFRLITNKSLTSDEKIERPFIRFDGWIDIYFLDHLQNF